MDEMTPRQRANYLVAKIKSKLDSNGKIVQINLKSGGNLPNLSNQLDTLPEIPNQSEQSSGNIVQSDSSSLRTCKPQEKQEDTHLPNSNANILSIDRALGASPKSSSRPKISSLFAKKSPRANAIESQN